MELTKVNVKWEDGMWYPAMILRQINEEEVEVEFEDPDCPLEIVLISDTKPIEGGTYFPSIKPITGTFHWELFKNFCKFQLKNKGIFIPLSVKKLLTLNLKSSIFTVHANNRKNQRYRENMQELLSSLNSNEFLAFRQTRARVFCGSLQIDCTPDLTRIISHKNKSSEIIDEFPNLEQRDINTLRDAAKNWTPRGRRPDAISTLDFESCTRSDNIVRIQVITFNTRFVLNEDFSNVITVIKHKKNFDEWLKRALKYRKLPKPGKWQKSFKTLISDKPNC